jgi:hypothetical protein
MDCANTLKIATVIVLAAALAGCGQKGEEATKTGVAPLTPIPTGDPAVTVALSPRAQGELEQRNEKITVAASWYGDPLPAAQAQVDETGRVAPGRREWQLPAQGGRVDLVPDAGTRDAFAGIAGPVGINVNVYSSRLSGPDNLLSCDFIDGEVEAVAMTPLTLSCGLIEESPTTRAYP